MSTDRFSNQGVFYKETVTGEEHLVFCQREINRLLPRCQKADREEIVQEALLRFYAKPPDQPSSWGSYLGKIIENLVSDYLASHPNLSCEDIDPDWDLGSGHRLAKTIDPPGHMVTLQQVTTDAVCNLRNSYQRSDSRNRLLVELDVAGEEYAEIAERLGYSEISKVTRQLRILRSSGRYWELWLTDERLEALEQAVERKASYAQIAQALGVNPEQARYLKNKVLPTLSRSSCSMSAGEDAAPQSADSRSGRDLPSPSLATAR